MKRLFWGKTLNGISSLLTRSILSLVPLLIIVWIIIAISDVLLRIFSPIIDLATRHIGKEYHLIISAGIILTIIVMFGFISWLLDRGALKIVKKQWVKARNAFYRAILKSQGKGMVVIIKTYDKEGPEELGVFIGLVVEICDGIKTIKAKVAVPGAPIPITGMIRLYPLDRVWKTNLTIEELVKQITSFGLATLKKVNSQRLDRIPLRELVDAE